MGKLIELNACTTASYELHVVQYWQECLQILKKIWSLHVAIIDLTIYKASTFFYRVSQRQTQFL